MILLDTFCRAGGAGMGYHQAGFEVVGVDIEPQPNYPFEFIQGDAIEFIAKHGHEFDAIHASPPCQKFSTMTNGLWKDRTEQHPDLIAPTRKELIDTGKPFIIENVSGARSELINPIMLCGTMFGLQNENGNQLRRHRYFEGLFIFTPTCRHNNMQSVGVYGHSGGSSRRDGLTMFSVEDWKEVMQIDWMTGAELAEAIPPAYTKFIGEHLMKHLKNRRQP